MDLQGIPTQEQFEAEILRRLNTGGVVLVQVAILKKSEEEGTPFNMTDAVAVTSSTAPLYLELGPSDMLTCIEALAKECASQSQEKILGFIRGPKAS